MRLLNLRRQNGAKNTNFKMYKAGRKWVFGSLLAFAVVGGLGLSQVVTANESVVRAEETTPTDGNAQLVKPDGTVSLESGVTITGDNAKDYFSLIRTTLGSSSTQTPVPLDGSGNVQILNGPSQNANVVMTNKFDMTTPVNLSGSSKIGPAKESSNGSTEDPNATKQSTGDGLGIILANVDPQLISSGTPGDGDTNMGIVGMHSGDGENSQLLDPTVTQPLFIGWDMFIQGAKAGQDTSKSS
ncbi:KxYKxGKxW signal peptide domain-containing protein [Lacticaseibacillus saniviri]